MVLGHGRVDGIFPFIYVVLTVDVEEELKDRAGHLDSGFSD